LFALTLEDLAGLSQPVIYPSMALDLTMAPP